MHRQQQHSAGFARFEILIIIATGGLIALIIIASLSAA